MTNSRYSIMFWSEVGSDGDFETNGDGQRLVHVGITTKPGKSLDYELYNSTSDIFVFFVGKIRSHQSFLREIEQLQVDKDTYLLEPLTSLLRRKCKENDFAPYKMLNKKSKAKSKRRDAF